jgi:hypothetical protein
VLGACRIERGIIRRGAVVTNTLAEEIDARQGSLVMGAYQPKGKLTSKTGYLSSDVFIDEKGNNSCVRVEIQLNADIRKIFKDKLWGDTQKYSFSDIISNFDMQSTIYFLDNGLPRNMPNAVFAHNIKARKAIFSSN